MERKVSVKTSSGTKLYKVSDSSGTYYCKRYNDSRLFGGWDGIGKAKNLDDALAIIKSHAGKYGSVRSVDIE